MFAVTRVPRILMSLLLVCVISAVAVAGPDYENSETKEVIEKMIEAHGGMEVWRKAQTFSYTNTFFNPFAADGPGNPWWISDETIDQKTRHLYQDWPLENAQLVYDGKETWTTNWNMGNQPKFMAHFFYYFLGLPWLTQDSNVILSAVEMASLPNMEEETFYSVTMTFEESRSPGMTGGESFNLYIDTETHILRAYSYTVTYGAMLDLMGLPKEATQMGPMLRYHDDFVEVDGMTLPSRMHTGSADGKDTYGYHALTNYSFSKKFDKARLKKPPGAIVDESSGERATS